ncbi:MAG: hypothetical protein ACPG40_09360 [Alphaproteobacteria bacterium]
MLASIFHGAQGLFIWTLDWLNFGANAPSGSEALDTAQASALHLSDASRVQTSNRGSFEQVDRTAVLDQVSTWEDRAPSLASVSEDTALLAAAAWIEPVEGSDADLIIQFALGDPNQLSEASLRDIGEQVATLDAFSPLVQPAIEIDLNDDETASLLTIKGAAYQSLSDVYLPLEFTVMDSTGDAVDFDVLVGIWNTDLI